MALFENISLAISGLKANKMRALLTMLGIIIGIGAVIGIVMVGDSLTSFMTTSLQDIGANNIQVNIQQKPSEYGTSYNVSLDEDDLLNTDMIDSFLERYGEVVEAVSLSESLGTGKAMDGRLYANVSIAGVNSGYQKANNITMLKGRFISQRDEEVASDVAVVSDRLVNNMFPNGEDPLGKELRVRTSEGYNTYAIVGVYEYEMNPMMAMMMGATASDKDLQTELYIPVSTAKQQAGLDEGYYYISIITKQGTDARSLAGGFEEFFAKYYERNKDFTVMATSLDSIIDQYAAMMDTMKVAISVIAAISLLVGGIGVMNIMLVSVTERTREIGTRKALGAKNSAIRTQFIVESVIICLIGGLIGIAVGIGLGYVGATILGFPATPSLDAIAIAVSFSMLIGVFFGYYPANKAAKLDPIEALRYE